MSASEQSSVSSDMGDTSSSIESGSSDMEGASSENKSGDAEETKEPAQTLEEYKDILDYTSDDEEYRTYLKSIDTTELPQQEIDLTSDNFTGAEGMEPEILDNYEGYDGSAVLTDESGMIEYEFDVAQAGFYSLSMEYYPVEGNSSSIQRSFFLDGVLPYKELSLIQFSRVFKNVSDTWTVDNQGNDLRPEQTEAPEWITSGLYDSDGYITEPLGLYLSKGHHKLTVVSLREPCLIGKIIFKNRSGVKSYEEQKAAWDAEGAALTSKQEITIQAEDAVKKSSQMLYPTQDQSSPAVAPYSAKCLKNNTIGGNSWRIAGDWIEWEFEAPEDGYYNITLHSRQNFVQGTYVSRKIMIDGEVPFSELSDYAFRYKSDWTMTTLSDKDGNAYSIYLSKGKHSIRMEAVLGDFSEIVDDTQGIVTDLNKEYRKIIRITGVSPDEFRDYEIEKSIPELGTELGGIADRLDDVIEQLRQTSGTRSDKEAVLVTMRDQLRRIQKDPEKITKMVSDFKTNVSAIGTWITQVISQPLQLDAIYITSPDIPEVKVHNSFWDKLAHEIKKLYWSFIIDYNAIGNVNEDTGDTRTITVWVGTGRDQANVIKELADDDFTTETGISVNVMLVDMNTLLQATLSGQGPDIAMQVSNTSSGGVAASSGTTSNSNDLPMNYGLRNAVVDLASLPFLTDGELEEVKERFRESALEPFEYGDALYALPETQTFPMMFYRKDILNELGISVPTTWDEMKVDMSILNENQMELGMLPSELNWTSLLYQYGGELYTEDATASALNEENAVTAFKNYTEYYTDYKLDRETSVENRFRTGECPIIIADYTTYNNFSVSAPDIKGLWGFAPLPGVVKEDGTIDNTAASTGLACMMMKGCEDQEAAWEYMKWWTGADTQTQYGREMESLMGAAARYPSANMEAFQNLPWPADDYEALEAQFENVRGIRQVPGGYYSFRNVNNAFYRVVVSSGEDRLPAREALTEYVRYIDDEITSKRKEFGMTTAQD